MIKKLMINIIIAIILLTALSSCSKAENDKDVVQLWYYHFDEDKGYSDSLVTKVKIYCEEKNIPLKIFRYDNDTISYKDYEFKRNIAANYGNFITIDDARNMYNIQNEHVDYIKLSNYANLLDVHKDRFCIPIGINYGVTTINNDAIEYYGIDTSEKRVISYSYYLNLKQKMKEKGARFELNSREINEIVEYCLNKNGLLFIDKRSDDIKNIDKFKEMIKKSVLDVCNNIMLYNNGSLDRDKSINKGVQGSAYLYDKNIDLIFSEGFDTTSNIITRYLFRNIENIFDKTLVINPLYLRYSPSLFVHKKVTNDKVYDVANFIISDSNYSLLIHDNLTPYTNYTPTFDTENIRDMLQVNDNWEYVKRPNEDIETEMIYVINEIYSIIVKDKNVSKEIADYYYLNPYINRSYDYESLIIMELVSDIILEIDQKLSLEKFDFENEEMNKIMDDKIDEFVKDFYVHHY